MSNSAPNGPLRRDILRLTGPDTFSLLQGLLTQNMDRLTTEEPVQYAALLTPQGKIIETMFLSRDGDDSLFIDVAAGRGAAFAKKLMLYRLRAKVEIGNVTDTHQIIVGPDAAHRDPRHDALPPRAVTAAPSDQGFCDDAYERLEIELGVPAFGVAYNEAATFPLNVNLDALNGIDHKKGCFVGQEVASRMFRKGTIRKRTWAVTGTGLEAGSPLSIDGQTVAEIIAVSSDAGLAAVRLDRLPDAATRVPALTADGTEVQLCAPEYLS